MAKGQMRSNKEKKKPKQDKNKQKGAAAPVAVRRHAQPIQARHQPVRQEVLEHDPEKWSPVFGKDHTQSKC